MAALDSYLAQSAANGTTTAASDAMASVTSNDSAIGLGAVVTTVVAALVIYARLR